MKFFRPLHRPRHPTLDSRINLSRYFNGAGNAVPFTHTPPVTFDAQGVKGMEQVVQNDVGPRSRLIQNTRGELPHEMCLQTHNGEEPLMAQDAQNDERPTTTLAFEHSTNKRWHLPHMDRSFTQSDCQPSLAKNRCWHWTCDKMNDHQQCPAIEPRSKHVRTTASHGLTANFRRPRLIVRTRRAKEAGPPISIDIHQNTREPEPHDICLQTVTSQEPLLKRDVRNEVEPQTF